MPFFTVKDTSNIQAHLNLNILKDCILIKKMFLLTSLFLFILILIE